MICIQCPSCNARMSAQDAEAGRKVACPKCGQRLQIPPAPARVSSSQNRQASVAVPRPRPAGTNADQIPESRVRPFILGAVCGLLLGLVIGTAATLGIVAVRGTRAEDANRVAGPAADQPGVKAGPARDDSGRSKTAGMTRQEFRQKLMQCQGASGNYWNGGNSQPGSYGFAMLRRDFDIVFGQPSKTQIIGKIAYWHYQCSDGEIQMVLRHQPPTQEKMRFAHVDGKDRAYTSEELLFLNAVNDL